MANSDQAFQGSIPVLYDQLLEHLLFRPYAQDIAGRMSKIAPKRLLETAAGTGFVTYELARSLPSTTDIVATDLNQAMLDIASAKVKAPNVTWQQCNAMELPFGDGEFDAAICQFGVMFFPDKPAAYREVRRVLRPGGTFLFNVWDSLDTNELPKVVSETVAAAFPHDPPNFFARTPYGFFDVDQIKTDLGGAGFAHISTERVRLRSRSVSAQDAAMGLCQGTPLRSEIEKRAASRLVAVTESAAAAVSARFGSGPIDVPMQAIIVSARAA